MPPTRHDRAAGHRWLRYNFDAAPAPAKAVAWLTGAAQSGSTLAGTYVDVETPSPTAFFPSAPAGFFRLKP
ncbi:MAG: hypothetical protein DVB31_14725 [Verrucomicrobia bacterium]|nr:MAG: hypothetical protein DVB31_14725 [Verrucomicrobiota bacterium]